MRFDHFNFDLQTGAMDRKKQIINTRKHTGGYQFRYFRVIKKMK